MKLATCKSQSQPRPALVLNDGLIDLWTLYEAANIAPPLSLDGLVQQGKAELDKLENLASKIDSFGIETVPLSVAELDAPLRSPSKLICIGLNYADHCREQNIPLPESPVVFVKFPSSIIGPGEAITWQQEISEQVDYEAELAFVIGQKASKVKAKNAYDYVAGYTIVNDISARDVQFADKQWVRGKSFDTFCPMGPFLVTKEEVPNPQKLGIRCTLNGDLKQDSNTSEMIFQIPFLIEFITSTCTLFPGDIVSTGTPHGVGVFQEPKVFLKPGDTVEVEIDGLGTLRNPVG